MDLLRFVRYFNIVSVCFGSLLILSAFPAFIYAPALLGGSRAEVLSRGLYALSYLATGVFIVYFVIQIVYGVRAIMNRAGSKKLSPSEG
jgi:hypothetical protein